MKIKDSWFRDEQGRTLMLRGVNLAGSSKVPSHPQLATHVREGFYDHVNVSFVGRPFPLEEADEHLSRLKSWGFTFLRFLVTWEAVEHAGPGIYDREYLDYVYEVVRKAGEHGIDLFIDPHQDVWSRMSGGDGAPGWTFDTVGMDVTRLSETGAAIVHAVHGDPFPKMIWFTNGDKLASATMFTLFFGGNDFAPQTLVDGEPVQEYLQRHYIEAIKQIAYRLKGLPNVVGYDTMNEPLAGFIGRTDLLGHEGRVTLGESPTPLQAMLLGAGYPQEVGVWELSFMGIRKRGTRLLNPEGVYVWQVGRDCVWRENGVWDVGANGQAHLLRPDHFARVDDRPVEFQTDYLLPFLKRFTGEIRSVDPDAIVFLEAQPRKPVSRWNLEDMPNVVHAAHWYDGLTLATKRYIPFLGVDFNSTKLVFGRKRVRRSFADQLGRIKAESASEMGGIPTLLGEFGIPFDLRNGRAYRTGDFRRQVQALDDTMQALEANLMNGTLWNYTPDNTNHRGDQWNDEDLSIFSRDQQTDRDDLNSGGRALEAAVRPYPQRVAGEPLELAFDLKRRILRFSFRHDKAIKAPTELYIPNLQYPDGYLVSVSDGDYDIDLKSQTLIYRHSPDFPVHNVLIGPPGSRCPGS